MKTRQRRLGFVVAAVLTATLLTQEVQPVMADSAKTSGAPIMTLPGLATVPGSGSMVVRTKDSVSMTMHTADLVPGYAYTAWWVIFNQPQKCATSPCGEPDLFIPEVNASVLYAAGQIAGDEGTANFGSFLATEDMTEALFGPGVLNTRKAEIHLVVRSHGLASADPAILAAQVGSFDGGCPPNACEDVQAAVHQP